MHGDAGSMLLISGNAYGSNNRFNTEPKNKNHYMENVRRMRQIQRQSKAREADSHKPVKALWQSDKYSNVTSKIKEDIQKGPDAPRPHSARFLRAHSRAGPTPCVQSARTRPSTPDPPSEKLTVPKAELSKDVQFTRNDFNFIKINGINAKRSQIPRSPSLTALDDLKKHKEEEFNTHHKFGQVPRYLETRRGQWKKNEEDRIANTPDPDLPPGHRVLPESERKTTLTLLKQKEEELVRQLSALPLRMDTFRIRTHKGELEQKLAEIEEAKKIFSRSKVFVKID